MAKNRVPPSRHEKLSRPSLQRPHPVEIQAPRRAPSQSWANVALLAIGFVCGILSLKIFDKYEQRQEVRRMVTQTTADTAWMKVKALRAKIYDEPHKKATPVGMYYKDFRFEIAGRSGAEWVKIGPDRYMHLSDLEGIEKKKF